jgi:3,4-dihydroxy 2-butanone 4-phosphate synthase/GTP cyclohydrolase II
LEPSAVLIEVLHEDGSMARRPELEVFAPKHGLKIGSIADLIRYRLETEKTVQRVHEEDVQTEFGPFRLVAYRDAIRHGLHFALVRGTVNDGARCFRACMCATRCRMCCICSATILASP